MSGLHKLPRSDIVHLADIQPRLPVFTVWERHRHRQAHWFVESAAEAVRRLPLSFYGIT